MNIYCNNKPVVVNNSINLQQFLELNKVFELKGIAVAVNNKVVPKSNWQTYMLSDSDKVLVISATKGG